MLQVFIGPGKSHTATMMDVGEPDSTSPIWEVRFNMTREGKKTFCRPTWNWELVLILFLEDEKSGLLLSAKIVVVENDETRIRTRRKRCWWGSFIYLFFSEIFFSKFVLYFFWRREHWWEIEIIFKMIRLIFESIFFTFFSLSIADFVWWKLFSSFFRKNSKSNCRYSKQKKSLLFSDFLFFVFDFLLIIY